MAERLPDRLTYGEYLRIPELLSLQSPLGEPPTSGEMLFILGQQAQELWFKQLLLDVTEVVRLAVERELIPATRLLQRACRILETLSSEMRILETLPPEEFITFRSRLKTASGLESIQFRELELLSGLRDEEYLRFAGRMVDLDDVSRRRLETLHDAVLAVLRDVDRDPVTAVLRVYRGSPSDGAVHAFLESCAEYDLNFVGWRFHHLRVVERVIGDRSPGTAGSVGAGYLGQTLAYRFFPELWEARSRLSRGTSTEM